MAITIAVSLQKGGTGKTTTAETLAAIWGYQGKRVLLVDMDSQQNATFISGIEPIKTISDVLSGEAETTEAIYQANHYNIMAGDEYLANLERIDDISSNLLSGLLEDVTDQYDLIIIDTPPAIGNLLKNSLCASDYVVIPTDARPLSVKGLDALEPTLEAVKVVSPSFKVLGVVLVKYSERTVLNRQIRDLLTERVTTMGTVLFDARIREGIAVPESQAMQMSLVDYAPKSNPCMDYLALADEIIKKIGV